MNVCGSSALCLITDAGHALAPKTSQPCPFGHFAPAGDVTVDQARIDRRFQAAPRRCQAQRATPGEVVVHQRRRRAHQVQQAFAVVRVNRSSIAPRLPQLTPGRRIFGRVDGVLAGLSPIGDSRLDDFRTWSASSGACTPKGPAIGGRIGTVMPASGHFRFSLSLRRCRQRRDAFPAFVWWRSPGRSASWCQFGAPSRRKIRACRPDATMRLSSALRRSAIVAGVHDQCHDTKAPWRQQIHEAEGPAESAPAGICRAGDSRSAHMPARFRQDRQTLASSTSVWPAIQVGEQRRHANTGMWSCNVGHQQAKRRELKLAGTV